MIAGALFSLPNFVLATHLKILEFGFVCHPALSMLGRLTRVPGRVDWRKVIAEKNPAINAFVCTAPENGQPGPLHGLGIGIKDNICTADMPTTCSSRMLMGTEYLVQASSQLISIDFKPPFDATVVQLLRQAGADILGKTNCDEFGMGCVYICYM